MRRNFLFLFLLLITPLFGCAITYSANPITARVVDAETKEPIEKVIVVAHWQLKGGMEGGNEVGQVMVLETETDKNGQFYFPGWGPKLRSLSGTLKDESPAILLFKNGYRYRGLSNEINKKTLYGDLDVPLKSDWDGKTIEVEKFKGTVEEYVRHVSSFSGNLRFVEDNCQWKIVPRMILELQKQLDVFKAAGIVTGFYSVDYLPMNKEDEAKCGSPKEFFKEYQK